MNWIDILKEQQIDLGKRIKSNILLHCEQENKYSEIVVITGSVLDDITQFCQEISYENKFDDSWTNVFNNGFRSKLIEIVFQNNFSDLPTEITPIYTAVLQGKELNHNVIKVNNFRVLVKISYGDVDSCEWIFTPQELKENDVLVCLLSQEKFTINNSEYKLILAGFLPTNLISQKTERLVLTFQKLLYSGGLKSYLKGNNSRENRYRKTARQCNQRGDYIGAIANYSKVLKINSQIPKIYLLRGICRWKIGDKQGAVDDFSMAIKLDHNYYLAYHWRGFIYCQITNYQAAIDDYSTEIKIYPRSAYGYYQRAFVRFKMHDYLGALEDYSMAITINKNFNQAYYNRGISNYKLGNKQGAIEDYNQALKLNPNLGQAYYNRGVINAQFGEFKKAIKDYQDAIKINPSYDKAYYNLAIIHADLGQYKNAINIYHQVININPDYVQAEYNQRALINFEKKDQLLQKENQINYKTRPDKNYSSPYQIESRLSNPGLSKNEIEIDESSLVSDILLDKNFPKIVTNPWASLSEEPKEEEKK